MTIKALYPTVRPTLNLDFAKTKALDPRVTFTRASTATFVGANGLIQSAASGAARFDHNPTTGESLGLLVEEARTNSLWPSEPTTATLRNTAGEPGNAWAVYDGTVTSVGRNGITGLEVTIGSSLDNNGFSGGGATNWAGIGGGGIFSTSATGSLSFFIHPLTWTANIAVKRLPAGGNPTFESFTELFNGGVYTGPASYVKAIFPDGTYWLHNISWTSLSTSTSYAQFPVILTTTPGDNIKKFWAGGFQWEAGAFSTSYIPTTSATVTRAADVASMTGTNFSSWYNNTEGTVFTDFRLEADRAGTRWATQIGPTASTGPNSNVIGKVDNNLAYAETRNASATQYSASITFPSSRRARIAYAIKNLSHQAAFNGVLATAGTGTLGTPSDTVLLLGRNVSSTEILCGTIARLAFYPVRLPEAQLQAITAP